MDVYLNIILVILSIITIIILISIINLIINITSFIDAKKQDITVRNNRLSSSNLLEKCEATSAILKMIDIIVTIEIEGLIRSYSSLNKKYEINLMTDDIERLSNNVYNAIKKEIYFNDDSIITEEYLMTYITSIVSMNLIQQSNELNLTIYKEIKNG